MPDIRSSELCLFAQISDPHIKAEGRLSYRQVNTAAALGRAIDTLNALSPSPSAVLISGDLTDFGRAEEYAACHELLARLHMPYYLVPGNHDNRDALRDAFGERDHLFQHERFLQWVVDDYPVRLVGLDSSVPGQPHGELCSERLLWLDAVLTQRPEQPTLVMLHHHPFSSGIAHMDRQPLNNPGALAEVISGHPQVERILCGHLHRAIQARFAGTLAMSCPGVSHQVSLDLVPHGPATFHLEPPGYLLHQWRAGYGLVTHQGVIGDYPGPFPFYDEHGLID